MSKSKELKAFEGIEAEGRWRGFKTLFLPASALFLEPLSRTDLGDYAHLYLGASDDYVTKDHLLICTLLVSTLTEACFTIECGVDVLQHLTPLLLHSPRVRLMASLQLPGMLSKDNNIEVKLTDTQHAHVFSHLHSIPLDYLKDKDLP